MIEENVKIKGVKKMEITGIDRAEAENGRVMAIVGYIGILFLLLLFFMRDNRFARYHANQSILLFLTGLAAAVLHIIPIIGWLLFGILYVFCWVCRIIGIVHAVQLRAAPLPVIGEVAEIIRSY